MDIIQKAIKYAAEAHRDQVRKVSHLPYIIHPLAVAFLVFKYGVNETYEHKQQLACVAILHDTLEDTSREYKDIDESFGSRIADLVLELTSDKEVARQMGKNNYLIDKMQNMSDDAFFVKLCDRLSNISDNPWEKYVKDTIIMMNTLISTCSESKQRYKQIMVDILNTCKNK